MKNFILFFPSDKKANRAFEHLRPQLEKREMQMLSRISQKYVNIYMVRSTKNFFWWNNFLPEFQLDWNIWKKYNSLSQVQWDLVYGFKMPEWVTHRYPSNIRDITIDKRVIQDIFPSLTLKSVVCDSYEEIKKEFSCFPWDIKVLKPICESRGRWIFISQNLPKEEEFQVSHFPYLIQEFHDTSWWFYELCSGIHDFRVVILNWEIISLVLREPDEGTYISNTNFWWKITDVSNYILPESVRQVVNSVEQYCVRYQHRYYSIDIWLGIHWDIKIFELNGAPALSNEYIAHKFWDYTARHILQVPEKYLKSL